MLLKETVWDGIVNQISGAFRLASDESAALRRNRVAKLIASIPYNSECENMERTALAHLGTYMLAKDRFCKTDFSHTESDDSDPLKRMSLMNHFQGGNNEVIVRGLNMLALCQLEDHNCDAESDAADGRYNPLVSGAWDYRKQRDYLIEEIEKVSCPEMDAVMSTDNVPGFWDGTGKN